MQPKCHPGILVAALCLIVAYPVAGAPQCNDESNPVAHVPGHTFNGDKNALATIGQSTIDQRSAIYAEHVVQQPTPRIIMYKRPTARVPELREKTVEEVPALLGDNLLLGTVHDQNPQWINRRPRLLCRHKREPQLCRTFANGIKIGFRQCWNTTD